ncbi:unnamed protein product [Chironomus riparius]|uniref:Uncharacterized protein n=1 Tax=Chironomus riparius TaxID=315576 RepID=A0A9N9RTG5_9DIPT|nr:unnamed protein product [Chironomus riparius]
MSSVIMTSKLCNEVCRMEILQVNLPIFFLVAGLPVTVRENISRFQMHKLWKKTKKTSRVPNSLKKVP